QLYNDIAFKSHVFPVSLVKCGFSSSINSCNHLKSTSHYYKSKKTLRCGI
ncbi:unnamed protein product, partial [Larinioides sclopetarius]